MDISIYEAWDRDDFFIKEIKHNYCVLALSSILYSPQMWAYYCNNYSGVCFCFKNKGSFNAAKKVEYVKSLSEDYKPYNVQDNQDLIDEIHKQLFCKHFGWQKESEWRIVRKKTNDKEYFSFSRDELVAIIIGHNAEEETKSLLRKLIPNNIRAFKTHPGERSRVLHILPYEHELIGDGLKPPFISDITAFEDFMKNEQLY